MGISWYPAVSACASAGLHLCTTAEWNDACAGPPGRARPTPDGSYTAGSCGIRATGPQPLPCGSWPECHTPEGVNDLLGNIWEWADPRLPQPDATAIADKHGGAHYTDDAAGCAFEGINSDPAWFVGPVGFRCCAPVQSG